MGTTKGRGQPPATLGEALRQEMARRGMNQVETATELGVVKQTVHDWISGRRAPSETKIPDLAAFLRMSPKRVLTLTRGSRSGDRLAQLEALMAELEDRVTEMEVLVDRRKRLTEGDHPGALGRQHS